MATSIFKLFGELGADIQPMQRGLRDAAGELQGFVKKVELTEAQQQRLFAQSAIVQQKLAQQTANIKEKLAQQSSQFEARQEFAAQRAAETAGIAKQRLSQQAAQFTVRQNALVEQAEKASEDRKLSIYERSNAARQRLAQRAYEFESRTAQQAASAIEKAQAKASAAAERAAKTAGRAWEKAFDAAEQAADRVGRGLTKFLTVPLTAAAYGILSTGTDYEKALNTFGAVTSATESEMKRAAETARTLGADLTLPATSAKDAGLAMSELGKAGLTANQAMVAAKGVLQLAAAGQLDEAKAAEIAANALNAFSLSARESTKVADLLAAAANASSSEVGQIAESLQQSSASFAAAKVPIDDLIASIGLLANAGIKGSDAGTSLKTFLSSIQAPSDKAAEKMEELGIKVFDAAGKFKGLPAVIGDFEKALSKLTDEKKTQAIQQIFGSDASRAAQILFKNGVAGFNAMDAAVNKLGAAAQLAAAKTKGVGGAWEAFKSQLETIGIDIFNAVSVPLSKILSFAADVVAGVGIAFNKLSPIAQQVTAVLGVVAAAVGPALVAFSALIASAKFVFATLGIAAIAPFLAKLALVVAAIAAIGAAIYGLYKIWQSNFAGIQQFTLTAFGAVKDTISGALGFIYNNVVQVIGGVVKWWNDNYPLIEQTVASVSANIQKRVSTVLAAIQDFWTNHGESITNIAKTIYTTIRDVMEAVYQQIEAVVKIVLNIINGDWSLAWKNFLEFVKFNTQGAVKLLGGMVKGIYYALAAAIPILADWGKKTGIVLATWIGKAIKAVVAILLNLPAILVELVPLMVKAGFDLGKAIKDGVLAGLTPGAATPEFKLPDFNLPDIASFFKTDPAEAAKQAAADAAQNAADSAVEAQVLALEKTTQTTAAITTQTAEVNKLADAYKNLKSATGMTDATNKATVAAKKVAPVWLDPNMSKPIEIKDFFPKSNAAPGNFIQDLGNQLDTLINQFKVGTAVTKEGATVILPNSNLRQQMESSSAVFDLINAKKLLREGGSPELIKQIQELIQALKNQPKPGLYLEVSPKLTVEGTKAAPLTGGQNDVLQNMTNPY